MSDPSTWMGVSVRVDGRRMKVEEIVDRLSLLGLEEDEAAVYLHLARTGASKASEVAEAVKLHRTDAYRTLDALVQRGFVQATVERPTRYEARPVDAVFADVRLAEQARLENILRIQSEVTSAIRAMGASAEKATAKKATRTIQGRTEALRALDRLLGQAGTSFTFVSTSPLAVQLAQATGLWEAARRRADGGLQVRALLADDERVRSALARVAPSSIDVRHASTERVAQVALADDREVLLWVSHDPSSRLLASDDVALWTNAPDLVGTLAWLVDSAWRGSRA